MDIINITEEQRKELCSELARLTFEFRKDKDVKCIYFAPYKGLGAIEGNVLELTIVRHNEFSTLEKLEEYNALHQEHNFVRKFGFKIIIDIDDVNKYTIMDLNSSECRRSKNLMNSTILYDESGEFTQIREQTINLVKANKGISEIYGYYDNLAEVYPPLDETLDNALDVARMKRDTEATKSPLFQYLKDMP